MNNTHIMYYYTIFENMQHFVFISITSRSRISIQEQMLWLLKVQGASTTTRYKPGLSVRPMIKHRNTLNSADRRALIHSLRTRTQCPAYDSTQKHTELSRQTSFDSFTENQDSVSGLWFNTETHWTQQTDELWFIHWEPGLSVRPMIQHRNTLNSADRRALIHSLRTRTQCPAYDSTQKHTELSRQTSFDSFTENQDSVSGLWFNTETHWTQQTDELWFIHSEPGLSVRPMIQHRNTLNSADRRALIHSLRTRTQCPAYDSTQKHTELSRQTSFDSFTQNQDSVSGLWFRTQKHTELSRQTSFDSFTQNQDSVSGPMIQHRNTLNSADRRALIHSLRTRTQCPAYDSEHRNTLNSADRRALIHSLRTRTQCPAYDSTQKHTELSRQTSFDSFTENQDSVSGLWFNTETHWTQQTDELWFIHSEPGLSVRPMIQNTETHWTQQTDELWFIHWEPGLSVRPMIQHRNTLNSADRRALIHSLTTRTQHPAYDSTQKHTELSRQTSFDSFTQNQDSVSGLWFNTETHWTQQTDELWFIHWEPGLSVRPMIKHRNTLNSADRRALIHSLRTRTQCPAYDSTQKHTELSRQTSFDSFTQNQDSASGLWFNTETHWTQQTDELWFIYWEPGLSVRPMIQHRNTLNSADRRALIHSLRTRTQHPAYDSTQKHTELSRQTSFDSFTENQDSVSGLWFNTETHWTQQTDELWFIYWEPGLSIRPMIQHRNTLNSADRRALIHSLRTRTQHPAYD